MIERIYIKDFVLIEEIELTLHTGLTTITGETGAGKSILIGAIGLTLGERSDAKKIRVGASKAIVELTCRAEGVPGLEALFEQYDLDFDPHCIIRREVSANGKSRAFVNDTPVTVAILQEIGARLVDIHSQHHNMLIGSKEYQLQVLDLYAHNSSLLAQYQKSYRHYRSLYQELKAEEARIAKQAADEDYIRFQFEQLEEAGLRIGELAHLEEQTSMAHHSLDIREALSALTALVEDHGEYQGAGTQISVSARMVEQVATHFPQGTEMSERLHNLRIELYDLAREAEHLLESLEIDPEQVAQMEERMDLIQSLMHKHQVNSEEELIALRDGWQELLDRLDHSDQHLSEMRVALAKAEKEARALAQKLSATRAQAGDELQRLLLPLMQELGIAGASFKSELIPLKHLTHDGADEANFLFATNKKTALQPIATIASGGEISRFTLALKSLLAQKMVLPTIIFDEIDTGVSGEVAEKLGQIMVEMSKSMQVLSITHLPQVASMAPHQLVVEKVEHPDEYLTTIREVVGEERVSVIADMLSGAEKSQAAVENARVLLKGVL